jgi:hypothetical protein
LNELVIAPLARRVLALGRDTNTRPICGAETVRLDGDAEGFNCPRHGKFKVAGSVLHSDAFLGATRQQWEAALEKARGRTIPGATPTTADFL